MKRLVNFSAVVVIFFREAEFAAEKFLSRLVRLLI